MRLGSMNPLGSYHNLAGSGQFQNTLYNTFPSNGMLGRLNTPVSLGMRGLPSSGVVHMGHAQNSSNSANDLSKFQPGTFPGSHSGSILQGMPMTSELNRLHNNGVSIGGLSNAIDDMTIFPPSNGFPDAKVTTLGSSSNPLLGIPSMVEGHLQESQGSRSLSVGMASLNSDLSSHVLDHGRCNNNWSNAVHSSGAQSHSFPLTDLGEKVSTMTLPLGPNSSQLQYGRTDLQGQAAPNNINVGRSISNASSQGFDFYKQDVGYGTGFMGSSMSSVTPVNGTLGCSLDTQNTNFGGSIDINLMRQSTFARHNEVDKSGLETSMQLHEGYLMGQHKLQENFVSNHFGSLEDLTTTLMRQDPDNHVKPNGDFGLGTYPPRTCP